MIIREDGINWSWFTKLSINPDGSSVTIEKHWRVHRGDAWPEELQNAIPAVDGNSWKEGEGRVALQYNVPGHGWMVISNPQYIFSYM
jgi:hypothetical protein